MQIILEQVTDTLRRRILEQAHGPGEHLTIDRLARELGVSQTPIREALGRLQGEGLVVYRRNQGYRVAPIAIHEIEEMLECRLALEPFAAQRIDPISSDFVGRLEAIHARFCAAMAAQQYVENNAADREFHETIVAATGNALLLRLFRSMDSHMYTMRVFYYSQHAQAQDLEETCAEHGRILEAFRAGNHAAAAAALTDHLHRVKGRVAALASLFPQ